MKFIFADTRQDYRHGKFQLTSKETHRENEYVCATVSRHAPARMNRCHMNGCDVFMQIKRSIYSSYQSKEERHFRCFCLQTVESRHFKIISQQSSSSILILNLDLVINSGLWERFIEISKHIFGDLYTHMQNNRSRRDSGCVFGYFNKTFSLATVYQIQIQYQYRTWTW